MNLRDPRLGKWLSGCHMASGFIISAIFLHSSTNKNHSSNRRCFGAHLACLDSLFQSSLPLLSITQQIWHQGNDIGHVT